MNKAAFEIFPAFAIPFAKTGLPEAEALNQQLAALFRDRASEGAAYRNINSVMAQSDAMFESRFDLWHWDEAPVRHLRDFCTAALFKVVGELNGYSDQELSSMRLNADAWFHLTAKGGSFGFHNHPMASWSGVYCVHSGYSEGERPESGVLQFMHPASTANMFVDLGVINLRSPWGVRPHEYRLRAGELVIFPSWVMHQVLPYLGEQTRITVAFNAWFRQVGQESPSDSSPT
tara:strand:- start:33 stop:728 length:696 start_codon:yes stop_codon:yes gene_type:complete